MPGEGKSTASEKDVAGYMMIQAENLNAAVRLLQASPLFDNGPNHHIELHEMMDMQ